jgi:hypothetical protein
MFFKYPLRASYSTSQAPSHGLKMKIIKALARPSASNGAINIVLL